MKNFVAVIIIMLLITGGTFTTASAVDVLVAMSLKTTGYNEILGAAQSACSQMTMTAVNLADNAEVNLPQLARSTRAKVVIALGDKALMLANATMRIPVIGAMVTYPKHLAVSFVAPPEMYLATLKKLGRKQVGVIYSGQMSKYVRQATDNARHYGITLIRLEADSPLEALKLFSESSGKIDSLWILPDTNVITSGSAEVLLRDSQEKNIPVIAFSKNYLKRGAVAVIEPNREAIGRAIGEAVCAMGEIPLSLENKNIYKVIPNEWLIDRLHLPKALLR